MTDRLRPAILICLTIFVFAAVFIFVPPIAQPEDYHRFADARGTVSGHTLKHLAAAWGVWWLLLMLKVREVIADQRSLS